MAEIIFFSFEAKLKQPVKSPQKPQCFGLKPSQLPTHPKAKEKRKLQVRIFRRVC